MGTTKPSDDDEESNIISTPTTTTGTCCCPCDDENGNGTNTTSLDRVGRQKAKNYRMHDGEVEREGRVRRPGEPLI